MSLYSSLVLRGALTLLMAFPLTFPAAAADGTVTEYSTPRTNLPEGPPKYLFHWTTLESWEGMLSDFQADGKFPLKTIQSLRTSNKPHLLSLSFPSLGGKPGLFAWSHPAAGMAVSGDEIYAREAELWRGNHWEKTAPVLVTIRLSAQARVSYVESNEEGLQNRAKLKGADLLLHEHYLPRPYFDGRSARFREWVLINAEAVDWFSASPDALPDVVRKELVEIADGKKSIAESERIDLKNYLGRPWAEYREGQAAIRAYLNSEAQFSL